jgi:hypothetical protein
MSIMMLFMCFRTLASPWKGANLLNCCCVCIIKGPVHSLQDEGIRKYLFLCPTYNYKRIPIVQLQQAAGLQSPKASCVRIATHAASIASHVATSRCRGYQYRTCLHLAADDVITPMERQQGVWRYWFCSITYRFNDVDPFDITAVFHHQLTKPRNGRNKLNRRWRFTEESAESGIQLSRVKLVLWRAYSHFK